MKKILLLILAVSFFSGMGYGAISWSTPVTISTALTNASDPQVVIDTNNHTTAIWIENGVIKASSLPSGGSWSTPISLSNTSNTSTNPLLAIDSSGNVTALWLENTVIESAILPFGGSWSAETAAISGSGASNPAFVVDASGHAVAIWQRSSYIESSTRISGSWSTVSVLSAINSSNPSVAISSVGKAIAAWHSISSGNDVIVTDILTISSNTWAATKNVFNGTASYLHNYPHIAIDSSGNASVAWFRYNLLDGDAFQNVQVIISALAATSSTWGIPTLVSNAGIRNPADLTIQIGYDAYGDALAVWTNSFDGETFSVESSRQLFGGIWSIALDPQSPTLYSFAIDLDISSGFALLINMAWDGTSVLYIISQEQDVQQPILEAWTDPNVFSTGSSNGYPKGAVSISGSTVYGGAVWMSSNGINTVINASTGSDSLVSSPSSVAVVQNVTNLGVYNDYYNTITWSASLDPNIIQYNIFRNGVYFSATSSSTFVVVDHNSASGETVTYGVAALRSDLRQSPTISYTLNP